VNMVMNLGVSCVRKKLLASQEGLGSIKLSSYYEKLIESQGNMLDTKMSDILSF
jgi:hypothetical protein